MRDRDTEEIKILQLTIHILTVATIEKNLITFPILEDMYWIDAARQIVVAEETESCSEEQIIYSDSIRSKIQKYDNLITLHSHPNSYPPSINDLNSNFANHYGLGIVVCHDGKIFKYASNNEYEAQILTLKDFTMKFDIMIEEVKEDDGI